MSLKIHNNISTLEAAAHNNDVIGNVCNVKECGAKSTMLTLENTISYQTYKHKLQ